MTIAIEWDVIPQTKQKLEYMTDLFFIGIKFHFFVFLSMCLLRQITHKLNKAHVKFVSDSPEFTH